MDNPNKIKVAIIGATSHIAKGLIYNFSDEPDYALTLFARNVRAVSEFLSSIGKESFRDIFPIESFPGGTYDVVINCVGVGTPKNASLTGRNILFITEQFDNMILKYIEANNSCLYLNFSSGAAYGAHFAEPVIPGYKNCIDINGISESDYYGIAKLHSETKHRALNELRIVDLRVFSYFSRFVDLTAGYLITDMINSIIGKREFITNNTDIIRDYVTPHDLFHLVCCCISHKKINSAFDVYSKAPITKMEMILLFEKELGLKFKYTESYKYVNATGDKTNYYSLRRDAKETGYQPGLSSAEGLLCETKYILKSYADNN